MFINRTRELSALRDAADNAPALVVVSGRRRVGKSALLDAAFEGRRLLSFQADEQDERGQLELLAEEASRLLPGQPPLRFDDWPAAIRFIEAQAAAEPLVVVLDEFQWLCAAQRALPSMLQRAWDGWQRQSVPVVLVLAGSALSFMDGLLAHGSPLYGRATLRPRVEPLDYRDSALFVPDLKAEAAIRRFAVLGGTPQYQVWAGSLPLARIIRERVLERGAPMYEEPLHLLRQGEGVRTPATYLSVLRVIAAGATQHNEISTKTTLSTANLSEKLARLRALGYVRVREPTGPAESPARGTYELADPFFRFWFRYVFPRRSRLERGLVDEVYSEIDGDLDNLMGPAFEECCRAWAGSTAGAKRLGEVDEIGSWQSRDGQTEIDVVGVRRGRYELVGSCKWRRRADERVLDELINARDRMGKASRARLAVFARDGFTDGLLARASGEDVQLVALADLFG